MLDDLAADFLRSERAVRPLDLASLASSVHQSHIQQSVLVQEQVLLANLELDPLTRLMPKRILLAGHFAWNWKPVA